MRATRFFGLQRSGNHAIIAWLMKNGLTDDQVFFNNCRVGRPVQRSFRQVERQGKRYASWDKKPQEIEAALARFPDYGEIYVSYENVDLVQAFGARKPISPDLDGNPLQNVLIKRDFLNWLASLWAMQTNLRGADGGGKPSVSGYANTLRMVDLWARNCTALHEGDGLEEAVIEVVDYDRWFQEEAYRLSLLERLQFPGRDTSLPDVQKYGRGSSFDGSDMRKRASEMAIDRRWAALTDAEDFKLLLRVILFDRQIVETLQQHSPQTLETLEQNFNLVP